jgi:hypothetical protein
MFSFVSCSGRFCPAPFVLACAESLSAVRRTYGCGRPDRGVAMAAFCRQELVRTIAPSLIPSTFTERRLTLSYNVCFGMPKSTAVA